MDVMHGGTLSSRLETIWNRAWNQDDGGRTRSALAGIDRSEALAMLRDALRRMHQFEEAAERDNVNQLQISRDTAEQIENVWIFSGVGTLRHPVKQPDPQKAYKGDNPALIKEFLKWGNRRRLLHGLLVAQRIAESRSGRPAPGQVLSEAASNEHNAGAMRDFMLKYGPIVTFGGFFSENDEARAERSRPQNGIAPEKFLIVEPAPGEPEWKNTTDQVRHFQEALSVRGMTTALVSDDIHLNRILHIAGRFHDYLPAGRPLYLFPSMLPEYGRQEYEDMELQGLLAYVFRDKVAAVEAFPYSLQR